MGNVAADSQSYAHFSGSQMDRFHTLSGNCRVSLFGLQTRDQLNLVYDDRAVGVVGSRAKGSAGTGNSPPGGLQEKLTVVLVFIEPAT